MFLGCCSGRESAAVVEPRYVGSNKQEVVGMEAPEAVTPMSTRSARALWPEVKPATPR